MALKKQYLGVFLMLAGGLLGAATLAMALISSGQMSVYLGMLILAGACALVGSILTFTQVLDHFTAPIVTEIEQDIQDDIEDVKKKRFTGAQVMLVVAVLAALIFAYYLLKLHKLDAAASWSGVPVAVWALIAVAIGAAIITRTRWFQNRTMPTPLWVFAVPVLGLILSLALGITRTEDARNLAWDATADAIYNNFVPPGINFVSQTGGFNLSLDCNDEGCIAIFLVVALIVITLLLVLGSAYITHFWVFSGCILLLFIGLIAVHEIRLQRSPPVSGEYT